MRHCAEKSTDVCGLTRRSYPQREALTVVLTLPPSELSQNGSQGASWMGRKAKANAVKWYRENAAAECKIEMGAGDAWQWPAATISLRFHFPDLRKRDLLNYAAMMKPAIDGCVDVGLIEGDDHFRLWVGGIEADIDRERPRVEMIFQRRNER